MGQNQQHCDEQARQELRDTIKRCGWKGTADLATHDIEFVVDLYDAGHLVVAEIRDFLRGMQITIDTLWELSDGSHEEEVRRLRRAAQSFNRVMASRRDVPIKNHGRERWSLGKAITWCEYLQEMRRFSQACCDSWRCHFGAAGENERPEFRFIEEIEKRIPVLRLTRLADVPAQSAAIEQVVFLNATLTVYAGHSEPLRRCCNSIAPAKGKSDSSERRAAFPEALLSSLADWVCDVAPVRKVQAEVYRCERLFRNDGRLDSQGRLINERAYLDPLYDDTGEVRSLGTIDDYSREVADHPNVHMEIENMDTVLKNAGLSPSQRRALLLRWNGKIMSRKHFREWKLGQRAISSKRSNLIKAIEAATKKRVIKAPLISGGSYTGLIREGAGYTFPLPDEDKPTDSHSLKLDTTRWFNATPPPISRSHRKTKILYKKVSTEPWLYE